MLKMEDCFEGFSEDITKWEIIRELTDLDIDDKKEKEKDKTDPGVQLLPRQDVMVYGIIPKMEQRIYSKCRECRLVFNPRDILSHKNCSGKAYYSHQNLKKKVKSKGISKKSHSGIPPPPLFKKPPSPPSVVVATPALNTLPELKVSVTKEILPRIPKLSPTSVPTTSTSSHSRSETRLTSSAIHVSKSSHNSKSSSSHSPRSPKPVTSSHLPKSPKSSSISHSPRSPKPVSSSQSPHSPPVLTHPSTKSSSNLSGHSPKSPTKPETKHSPRSPSKSASSHSHSSSSSKSSSKTSDAAHAGGSSTHFHSSTSVSSSSSRHKKSRRSNTSSKVATKEFDPDVHCGVMEGSRGPCTRSITCSNHRIQLRKLVSGRSKDIHQLIAERKAAKEKDFKHHSSSSSCSYTSPNGEEKEFFCQSTNTSYVPIVAKIVTTIESTSPMTTSYVPIMPKVTTNSRHVSTSFLATKKTNVIESEKDPFRKLTNGFTLPKSQNFESNSQDSAVGTVPVVYMPMSPISVVSPVQCVQIGNNMICLETQQAAMSPPLKNKSVFLPLPNNSSQHSNIKLYKSHPEPVVLPTFGTKKVGGSILFSNLRLRNQRNELLNALNKRRETVNNHWDAPLLNHSNTPHRPNILKAKSSSQQNCKRAASDKLISSDSKQIRLVPDVNGFILHADVSETADAPQSNDCLQGVATLYGNVSGVRSSAVLNSPPSTKAEGASDSLPLWLCL